MGMIKSTPTKLEQEIYRIIQNLSDKILRNILFMKVSGSGNASFPGYQLKNKNLVVY